MKKSYLKFEVFYFERSYSAQVEQPGPETAVPGNSDDFRPEHSFYVPAISGDFPRDPLAGILDLGNNVKLAIYFMGH